MNEKLKKRIVGGVVLVALGVIAIPMFSSDEEEQTRVKESIIPPKPQLEMQTSTVDLKAWSQSRVQIEDARGSTGALGATSDDDIDKNLEPRRTDVSTLENDPFIDQSVKKEKTTAVNVVSADPVEILRPVVKNDAQQPAPTIKPVVTQAKKTQQDVVKIARAATSSAHIQPSPKINSVKTGSSSSSWAVQVGSFRKKENAERLREKLKQLGYRAFVNTSRSAGKTVVRVRVGPQMAKASAKKVKSRIEQQMKMQAMLVKLK